MWTSFLKRGFLSLEQYSKSMTTFDTRLTLRSTISQPSAICSLSSSSMPVLTTKMPPSSPMRMFLIRWAIPATARPIRVSCLWSRLTSVMSVNISTTAVSLAVILDRHGVDDDVDLAADPSGERFFLGVELAVFECLSDEAVRAGRLCDSCRPRNKSLRCCSEVASIKCVRLNDLQVAIDDGDVAGYLVEESLVVSVGLLELVLEGLELRDIR